MRLCDANILYVDDEPLLLEIFGYWLTGARSKGIDTAVDGVEAMKMLAKNDYDLVITDVKHAEDEWNLSCTPHGGVAK